MKIISFGHRCSSASLIQLLNEKTESYPFDWMITKLSTIKKCVETDFVNFLDSNNYICKRMETSNIIDGKQQHICNENVLVNSHYETNMNNTSTYACQLAFNHRNIGTDLDYYKRCIDRFNAVFESDEIKCTIYIHPILGQDDYAKSINGIIGEFGGFSDFITAKYQNVYSLYFVLVKKTDSEIFTLVKATDRYTIYKIICNSEFIDGGDPCMGVHAAERDCMMDLIKAYKANLIPHL